MIVTRFVQSVRSLSPSLQSKTPWTTRQKIVAGAIGVAAVVGIGYLAYYLSSSSFLPSSSHSVSLPAIPIENPSVISSDLCPSLDVLRTANSNLCNDSEFGFICHGNLGIPRVAMPQLNSTLLENVKHWASEIGAPVTSGTVYPSSLLCVQKEIHLKNVMGLMQGIMDGKKLCTTDPVVISGDNSIIDGHHRFAACLLTSTPTAFIKIGASVQRVLSICQDLYFKRGGIGFL
jgi:hypothetical protein